MESIKELLAICMQYGGVLTVNYYGDRKLAKIRVLISSVDIKAGHTCEGMADCADYVLELVNEALED